MAEIILNIVMEVLIVLPWWLYVGVTITLYVCYLVSNKAHLPKIILSYWALNRLATIGENKGVKQQFFYLWKCSPYLYEEMILTAIKKSGHRIKRNSRYSSDGGIDGQCWIEGRHYLIQAKRYSSHITTSHVKEFNHICKKRGKFGLFIHTGKTGKGSWIAKGKHIEIISGRNMIDLLESKSITFTEKEFS